MKLLNTHLFLQSMPPAHRKSSVLKYPLLTGQLKKSGVSSLCFERIKNTKIKEQE
jgi:hypothetical protein